MIIKCEDCDGRGHDDEFVWQGHFQPPEPGACGSCGGSGSVSVTFIHCVSQADAIRPDLGDRRFAVIEADAVDNAVEFIRTRRARGDIVRVEQSPPAPEGPKINVVIDWSVK